MGSGVKSLAADVMREAVYAIKTHQYVAEAIEMMEEKMVSCLIVEDEHQNFVGITTKTDLLHAHKGEGGELVGDFMTQRSQLTCASPSTPAYECKRFMQLNHKHHMPVTDNGLPSGKLVGIISSLDI